MAILRVHLTLSYSEFMKYYQGHAKAVQARDQSGRTVRFPARGLQPFLTPAGINGDFEIEFSDDTQKLIAIRRVG